MISHQGNKTIEFTIEGYEFPEAELTKDDFNEEANWLMCEIRYSDDII